MTVVFKEMLEDRVEYNIDHLVVYSHQKMDPV